MMLRYGTALGVAAILILAGFFFVQTTVAEIKATSEQPRQRLKQQKADGTLPEHLKDADLDTVEFGMQVTPRMHRRINVSLLLADWWYIFIPLVVAMCLGAAFLLGRFLNRAV